METQFSKARIAFVKSRWLQSLAAGLIAAILVAGAYRIQDRSREIQERSQIEPWIIQMMHQVEWAVDQLNRSPEPRVLSMQLQNTATESQTRESNGSWTYTRLVDRVNEISVRITIQGSPRGVFGFQTQWAGDVFALALWIFLTGVLFLVFQNLSRGANQDFSFKKTAEEWLAQAKGLLVELGQHVRESVQSAQVLSQVLGQSREKVEAVRSQLSHELNEIHAVRTDLKSAASLQARVETHALNLVLDFSRREGQDMALLEMVEILRRDVASMREIHEKSLAAVEDLQKRFEPWSADLDEAFHAFDRLDGNAQQMDLASKRAAKNLIEQAKLIQLKNQVLGKAASTK